MSRRGALAVAAVLALAAGGCGRRGGSGPEPCPRYDCGGACVDVRVDAAHCGACGNACAAGEVCTAGVCALGCVEPLVACDAAEGKRCTALASDPAHCGACSVACPTGQLCAAGRCVPECQAPLTTCGSGPAAWCADLAADRLDCGACGRACAPGQGCEGGRCIPACGAPGSAVCADGCVDLFSDARHCGACGRACSAAEVCTGAACRDACAASALTRCGAGCADLASDPLHCGACGRACAGGGACRRGRCQPPPCAAGSYFPDRPDLISSVAGRELVAADVDGDGLTDLLVPGPDGAALWLLRARAGGGYGAPEVAVAAAVSPAATADLDGDGAPELLVTTGTSVDVYRNDGSGRFTASESYAHPEARFALAADLDGDGHPEVVTASSYSVRIWWGGSGAVPETFYANGIVRMAGGDVDGDGRPDLVLGDQGRATFSVLHNRGDRSFADAGAVDAGFFPTDLALADLDADGRLDVVFLGWDKSPPYGESVGVVRGSAAGFGAVELRPLPATESRYRLLAADGDGDGDVDVIVGERRGFRWLANRGDGTLAEPELVPSGVAQGPAVVDADGDGRADLIAVNGATSGIEVRRRLASGGWEGPEGLALQANEALLADLDGDGRDDLVTLRWATATDRRAALEVRLSRGATFEPPRVYPGFSWGDVRAADLDRDGRVDLLVSGGYGGAPGVLRNRGDGTLEAELPVVGLEGAVELADVTGDGLLDLVAPPRTVPFGPVEILVAPGLGNGSFAPPVATRTALAPIGGVMAVGDLDGDGHADLALLSCGVSVSILVFPGRADGTFGDPREVGLDLGPSSTWSVCMGLDIGDVDGDGRPDLVALLEHLHDGVVAVFRGAPAGFAPQELATVPGSVSALRLATVRGGGRADILVTGWNSLALLGALDGGGLAPPARWAVPDLRYGGVAAGDVDGDGRTDAIAADLGGAWVYRGACDRR